MLGDFAQHYGFTIFPIRPAHPKHNGKVERYITYVKGALKGRQFASLAEQNAWLRKWESETADQRIHGTTRKQVQSLFLEREKPALRPLPPSLFPCFQEGKRRVHQDSYVLVEQAYIILRRYERRSTIMTSNRPVKEWGKLLGDVPSATAILDRFLHHADIIQITGKSYRMATRQQRVAAPAAKGRSPSTTEPPEGELPA